MGDVFEMLLSLTDFDTFKELMLSYKQVGQSPSPHLVLPPLGGISLRMPRLPLRIGERGASKATWNLQEQQNGAPIKVDVRPVALCADEQGDGEHRPDLDAHLIVSPVSGRQG